MKVYDETGRPREIELVFGPSVVQVWEPARLREAGDGDLQMRQARRRVGVAGRAAVGAWLEEPAKELAAGYVVFGMNEVTTHHSLRLPNGQWWSLPRQGLVQLTNWAGRVIGRLFGGAAHGCHIVVPASKPWMHVSMATGKPIAFVSPQTTLYPDGRWEMYDLLKELGPDEEGCYGYFCAQPWYYVSAVRHGEPPPELSERDRRVADFVQELRGRPALDPQAVHPLGEVALQGDPVQHPLVADVEADATAEAEVTPESDTHNSAATDGQDAANTSTDRPWDRLGELTAADDGASS